jgi:hypothetical protein
MYTIPENVLTTLLKKKFNALVGKSCKRIEVLRDQKEISEEVKFNLLRDLIKELNYETMREIEETVIAFSDGAKISVNLKPIK